MLKATLLLWLAMACAGIGNVFLSKGMRTIGSLNEYKIKALVPYFLKCATNFHILMGIVINIAYFFLWLVVLSIADVSWALPMNAVEYLFVTLLAVFFLKEKVDWKRWLGVGFITVGVLFMMKSW